MKGDLFLTDYNSHSQKWLVFEDNGLTGWAYLTDNSAKQILVDCWVYNRIEAPDKTETHHHSNIPPPVPKQYLKDCTAMNMPNDEDISFKWTESGNCVQILIRNKIVAYIDGNQSRAYNTNLFMECAWGFPLS